MKQPSKGPGNKTPAAKAPSAKVKRKTREELDKEARDRKRQKKHSGHVAGSRANPVAGGSNKATPGNKPDPRIGSKKPVALDVIEETLLGKNTVVRPKSVEPTEPAGTRLSPQDELTLLENDDRLDDLLERLDDGEKLNAEDQQWVDKTLDRINALMDILGIELTDDDEEEKEEDMLQLLKRNHPKDPF